MGSDNHTKQQNQTLCSKTFYLSVITFKTNTNRYWISSFERFGDNSKNYFLINGGFRFLITKSDLQKMALFYSIWVRALYLRS